MRRGAVLVGGGAGTALRIGAADWLDTAAGAWPWATFGVNVAGSFVLAAVLTHMLDRARTSITVALVGAGAMGALTTFSTSLSSRGGWASSAGPAWRCST